MTSTIKRNKHNTEGQANIAKDVANGTSFHERKCVELYRKLEVASKQDYKIRVHNQQLQSLNDDLRDDLEAALVRASNAKWKGAVSTLLCVGVPLLLLNIIQATI